VPTANSTLAEHQLIQCEASRYKIEWVVLGGWGQSTYAIESDYSNDGHDNSVE